MIALRSPTNNDFDIIHAWPPYPPEFRELDYALRKDGWLDEDMLKVCEDVHIAENDGEIFGFSLLTRKSENSTEFRIALHPKNLGKGIVKTIARLTLEHGFSNPAIKSICLIVRKNNPRARKLYESLHFRNVGESIEEVNGNPVAFYQMEIDRNSFFEEII